MKIGCVYITTNKINNKRYIGSLLYERKNDWTKYLGSGKLLVSDIKKYGKDNFYKIIIEEAETEDELRKLEEKYILEYDAVNRDDFYNMKYSAKGGDTFTTNHNKEAIRIKHQQNASGEKNPMYKRPKTEKMITAVKRANSKKIEIDGTRYDSITTAANILNLKLTTLCYRLASDSFPTYKRI